MKKPDSQNLFRDLHEKGELHFHGDNAIFFGNHNFQEQNFPPNATFLHQVHGKKVVAASSGKPQADGHFTEIKNQALFIQTADCIPVFISQPHKIAALHIGWRGLMKKIFTEAINNIGSLKEAKILIGPHIHIDSFQLNKEFTEDLLTPHNLDIKAAKKKNLIKLSLDKRDHYYINLKEILKREINSIKNVEIKESPINTYTSPHHYSHRRNPWRTGRNFSFIIKT